jgi:uncharacterized membrane protein required for colicin V production
MGLDLALGVIILIAAFRGWFQGFMSQVVRLGALVASVYAAARVRDYVKPYVLPSLTTIQPDLVDRMLWWVSAVATWLVVVAVAMLVIKMTRRPEIPGISQSGRNDQFAGFFMGACKGVLIAAFVAAGIQKYAMDQVKTVSWGEDQVKSSWALKWNETYQPAHRIWVSRPVRHFIDHIQRMGLHRPGDPSDTPAGDDLGEDDVVRTASRPAEGGDNAHDRPASQSASQAHPSTSNTPPPAEAGETATEKADNRPKDAEKPAVDNAN